MRIYFITKTVHSTYDRMYFNDSTQICAAFRIRKKAIGNAKKIINNILKTNRIVSITNQKGNSIKESDYFKYDNEVYIANEYYRGHDLDEDFAIKIEEIELN